MAPQNRPLNPLERKIHQACITHENKILTQKEVDVLVPDVNLRVAAINFLLTTGMLKMMQDEKKQILYKGVLKKEMEVKKEMGGDENMVLDYIQNSGNEGIWTKHLKAKTELHQTVINRCLKSLEQKGLIKVVKSVKNPTRKIYMMSHLEPSVEVTGGPWYSENELDTEFIKMLSTACLRFIQERSYPKASLSSDGNASAAPLYPISQGPLYPTSKQIHSWLQKTKLSEQELGVEHVEMLLDVLVFDGEVEKLPAYGAGMWDMAAMDIDSEEEKREKKRKRKLEEEGRTSSKKAKGKQRSRKDKSRKDESESDTDKRTGKKKRKVAIKEGSDSGDEDHVKQRKQGKKRKREVSDDSEADSSEDNSDDSRVRLKKRKRSSSAKSTSRLGSKARRHSSSPSPSTSSGSESEASNTSSGSAREKRAKKKKKVTSFRSSEARHTSKAVFAMDSEPEGSDGRGILSGLGSANVYRAVRQERVSLGWSQAPCGRCPVFDFCHDTGPVKPKECTYFNDWVRQGIADF